MQYFGMPIKIPEGAYFTSVKIYEKTDIQNLKQIYIDWVGINKRIKEYQSKSIPVPELLSHGLLSNITNKQ